MKIFISHSSKNKFYGEKLVELLRSVGVKEDEIIFTSNRAYGIPIGQNIFNWLKSQFTENPFVIYLLSEEYYQSIACLNEMGAAWIIENKHAAIFTPNFNLLSKEFQNGVLDPREMGFYINNEEGIFSFLQLISEDFEISKKHVIISQSVTKFIREINDIKTETVTPPVLSATIEKPIVKDESKTIAQPQSKPEQLQPQPIQSSVTISSNPTDLFSKFAILITSKKLKDDELLLLHYIIDTGKFKLMTGWQEPIEIDNIKEWEVINEIDNKLSRSYSSILKRFDLRGLLEVSAVTSGNNPKEYKIKEEISKHLLDLPENLMDIITENFDKNHFAHTAKVQTEIEETDDLPF